MSNYRIQIEAIEVRTESGTCPGMANTRQGETFTLGARTPEGKGICTNALNAIYPMTFALWLTDKMDWEKKDHFDMVWPHGAVTYRMTRVTEKA